MNDVISPYSLPSIAMIVIVYLYRDYRVLILRFHDLISLNLIPRDEENIE